MIAVPSAAFGAVAGLIFASVVASVNISVSLGPKGLANSPQLNEAAIATRTMRVVGFPNSSVDSARSTKVPRAGGIAAERSLGFSLLSLTSVRTYGEACLSWY